MTDDIFSGESKFKKQMACAHFDSYVHVNLHNKFITSVKINKP